MSELKATDLRIGNWVQYDDGTKAKIYSIDAYRDVVGVTRFPQPLSLSVIQSIALSEDILLKCGFAPMSEDVKKELGIEPDDVSNTLVYKDTPICCYWDGVEYIFQYGRDVDLCFAACEFVHQLQNLMYCLLQNELPITL